MADIKTELEKAMRDGDVVGRTIMGLDVLRHAAAAMPTPGVGGELVLITQGSSPERIPVDRLGVDFAGITVHGRTIVRFADMKDWDDDRGAPCVCWEDRGRRSIVAPTRAIDVADIAKVEGRFAARADPDDQVFVSDLDRTFLGSGHPVALADGVLEIGGQQLAVADMTWADHEIDGDGVDHLHVVLADGRYRYVAMGDLSR